MSVLEKYARLLVDYALELKKDEQVFISTTYLAEPLLKEVYKATLQAGAHPYLKVDFEDREKIYYDNAKEHQLQYVSPISRQIMENFDAYLVIRAPFNLRETQNVDPAKRKMAREAAKPVNETYMQRTGSGDMKRCLCEYPTSAGAQAAEMSLMEYEQFIFDACNLFEEDPVSKWLDVRNMQQSIVNHLNTCSSVRYKNQDTDITFSTAGRKWINSDGRNNMPSGEVYTSPVEDSVNGHIHFTYPGYYMGKEVEDVVLKVEDGEIKCWEAAKGKDLLDEVFSIPGTRFFGEAAIGTNTKIQQMTKNILFDEKIGGTIHMAVGQSYYQTGGKNSSSVHWDLITDMTQGGEIYADDELIYKNGKFLIL